MLNLTFTGDCKSKCHEKEYHSRRCIIGCLCGCPTCGQEHTNHNMNDEEKEVIAAMKKFQKEKDI